jgi:hypothetical protein
MQSGGNSSLSQDCADAREKISRAKKRRILLPLHEVDFLGESWYLQDSELQYVGLPSETLDCLESIPCIAKMDRKLKLAKLLTSKNRHAFLLFTTDGRRTAVKPGFRSGYTGEGSHGLADALALHEWGLGYSGIVELDVEEELLARDLPPRQPRQPDGVVRT